MIDSSVTDSSATDSSATELSETKGIERKCLGWTRMHTVQMAKKEALGVALDSLSDRPWVHVCCLNEQKNLIDVLVADVVVVVVVSAEFAPARVGN